MSLWGIDTQAIAVTVQNVVGVTVNGTAGNDLIDATHTVAGQSLPTNEEDVIIGDKGRDTISGLGGNDTLNGGANADTMIGGTGNDTYVVDNSGDVVTENSGEGIDTVQSSVTYTLGLNMENLTLTGTSRIDGTGNAANNVITGNGANNVLAGLGGADVINGGGGNDTIKGGSDADTLTGGPGNDTFVLAAVADFWGENLEDDLYSENFADDLAEILQENLPEDRAKDAHTLARECARSEADAVDKVTKILAGIGLDMDEVLNDAKGRKAKELVQKYVRREPDAVKLVDELLTDAGVSMDALMADALAQKLDDIERIDRLTTIAESRRNASLHEIERRHAVFGETLRRSVQEIEDGEFEEIETTPAQGKNAA